MLRGCSSSMVPAGFPVALLNKLTVMPSFLEVAVNCSKQLSSIFVKIFEPLLPHILARVSFFLVSHSRSLFDVPLPILNAKVGKSCMGVHHADYICTKTYLSLCMETHCVRETVSFIAAFGK